MCEKLLITGRRIRNLRVRKRGLDCGEEGFELVLDRICFNDVKLALGELSHEMINALNAK